VLERVSLESMVRASMKLIPPSRLERLEVFIDQSVGRIGPLELPRITLQQVFQNLIINACEASQEGVAARLSVRANLNGSPGREFLQMSFRDNGSGVAPENLARLFDKGFSTKSARTNSGTGLHWTANAIIGLGGWITVNSDGPGHGAEFQIVLPLRSGAAGPRAVAA
jgi:two-component system, NtrC family, sensor kinase